MLTDGRCMIQTTPVKPRASSSPTKSLSSTHALASAWPPALPLICSFPFTALPSTFNSLFPLTPKRPGQLTP